MALFTSFYQGESSCLLAVWPAIPPDGPVIMDTLCQGRKKCMALVILDEEDTLHQEMEKPVTQLKYSIQVAWVMVKMVKEGFLVRLQCGEQANQWVEYVQDSKHCKIKC